MSTVDELREVLEQRAGVPEISGMVEAARAGVARVRCRRRITAATVAAGLVVVAAVTVTVQRLRAPGPLPAAPAPEPYRETGEYTVWLRTGERITVDGHPASMS